VMTHGQEREIKTLRHSLGFYKERCDELQKWQSKMRDPEREIVCQILANGFVIEALFPKPTDEQCRICEQAIRKDATGKVLDYLEDYMRQEEINDERTPYESFVWVLHQVIPSLRKGGQE